MVSTYSGRRVFLWFIQHLFFQVTNKKTHKTRCYFSAHCSARDLEVWYAVKIEVVSLKNKGGQITTKVVEGVLTGLVLCSSVSGPC